MRDIIISYRRKDSDAIAGRIRDRLGQHFGDKAVFMDIDSIPLGFDFRKHIDEALSENKLLLAIIGPHWTAPVEGGTARIFEVSDPVRIEVETALKRGIPTIPVLVGGAQMPTVEELPESLKDFPFFNAAEVSAGLDFHQHVDRLIRSVEQIIRERGLRDRAGAASLVRRPWVIATGAAAAILVVAGLAFALRGSLFGTARPAVQTAENAAPPPAAIANPPARIEQPVVPVPPPLPVQASQPPAQVVQLPVQTAQQPAPPAVAPILAPDQNTQPAAQAQTAPMQQLPGASDAASATLACDPGSVPIFYDNFKTVNPGWDGLGTDPRAGFYVANGQLVMTASPDDDIYFTRNSLLKNASICAEVVSPPVLNDPFGTSAGIMFWASSDNDYYDVLIFPGGGYKIEKWAKGSSTVLGQEKTSAIRSGLSAVNTIKITNRNSDNTLSINGIKIQDFKGQPGKNDGRIGLVANSEPKQVDEWHFSDVVMTQPNLADEFTDFGVPPQNVLKEDVGTRTPATIPGATIITTPQLDSALQRGSLDGAPFLLVDVLYGTHPKTIRGAKRIAFGGAAGGFDDDNQQRMRTQLMTLTKNNLTMPIVFFCEGAICWESYNAVLRAERMGFTRVYWYRGGLDAWKAADLPMN